MFPSALAVGQCAAVVLLGSHRTPDQAIAPLTVGLFFFFLDSLNSTRCWNQRPGDLTTHLVGRLTRSHVSKYPILHFPRYSPLPY